jgi:hypothetical protein
MSVGGEGNVLYSLYDWCIGRGVITAALVAGVKFPQRQGPHPILFDKTSTVP